MAILDDLKAAQAKANKKPAQMTTPGDVAAASNAKYAPAVTPTPIGAPKDAFGNKIGAPVTLDPDAKTIYDQVGKPADSASKSFVGPVTTDQVKKKDISSETMDAFASLRLIFESYGLGNLADTITKLMTNGETPQGALVKLKYDTGFINGKDGARWNDAYTTRFAGNTTRISKGLNALSEAEYITNENSYAETLKSYGLGNMLSVDRAANEKTFAAYIAGDVSPTEFKDRISTASDRVINADANTKAMFKQFYPNITDNDLVAYFLNPTETIGKLKEKTTAAEIGGIAIGQGLTTDMTSATDLAKFGVDRAGAMQGYANIAEVLPTAGKLSDIYKEAKIDYTQKTGESEFMKGNADAAEQRRRLKSMERAKFSGDSGVSAQAGSLSRSIQGKF